MYNTLVAPHIENKYPVTAADIKQLKKFSGMYFEPLDLLKRRQLESLNIWKMLSKEQL